MSPESSLLLTLGAGTLGRDDVEPEVSALREKSTEDSLRAPVEAVAAAAPKGLAAAALVASSCSLPADLMAPNKSALGRACGKAG